MDNTPTAPGTPVPPGGHALPDASVPVPVMPVVPVIPPLPASVSQTTMPVAPVPVRPATPVSALPTGIPTGPIMPTAPVAPAVQQATSTHTPATTPPATTLTVRPQPPHPSMLDLSQMGLSPEQQHSARLLLEVLASDESSEVIINGPNEVLQKVKGQRFHLPAIEFGDGEAYHRILNEVVLPYVDTHERIDGENILVEGQMELPSGKQGVPPVLARVHILAPPLVQFAKVTIAKKARYEFDLDAIAAKGAMNAAMCELLKAVARGRLTFVASGPTGAGKTTLLQAMSHNFDQTDRIVVIEDTPELRLPLADTVYLNSTAAKPGLNPEDVVTTEWLVKAANRMRMDRIIVGECRGSEMAEWLIAANSGAEGSATTVHADNPRRALDKILGLATKSQTSGSENTLRREIAATVDIVVQAGLIDGKHVITHIEEVSKTVTTSGVIATTTLFEYNRARGIHEVKARPSDDLQSVLRQRQVPLNMQLFRNPLS